MYLGLGYDQEGLLCSAPFSDLGLLGSMPHLTALNLSQNWSMSRLPPAIGGLLALETLNVTCSRALRLSSECVAVLKSLPRLRLLFISAKAVPEALAGAVLAAQFPDVKLVLSKW